MASKGRDFSIYFNEKEVSTMEKKKASKVLRSIDLKKTTAATFLSRLKDSYSDMSIRHEINDSYLAVVWTTNRGVGHAKFSKTKFDKLEGDELLASCARIRDDEDFCCVGLLYCAFSDGAHHFRPCICKDGTFLFVG